MNFREDKAIYLQIADYFYENILIKDMKSNDRIPSVRDLAVETEVNPNTVMRTYQFLQDNNIIFNKRGIGYFISDGAYEITHKMKKEEFITEKLPEFFKTLKNLNISMSEIEKFYKDFLSNNEKSVPDGKKIL
jgi:GntR family transcriptional regulator